MSCAIEAEFSEKGHGEVEGECGDEGDVGLGNTWLAWSARRSYWDSFSKNWIGFINRSASVMGWCLGFRFSGSGPGLGFRPSGSSRGVRLVPVVNRQRVQKALDLISCPVVGNIHGGRLRHTKSARKGRTVTDLHERRQRPDTQKWQSCTSSLPFDLVADLMYNSAILSLGRWPGNTKVPYSTRVPGGATFTNSKSP